MKKIAIKLQNEEGLHARPANMFSKAAMKFKCDIQLFKNGDTTKVFNPKSILSILSMGAMKGDELTIVANGEDEEAAIAKIADLIKNDFN
ncbi:MAG: HPr family phosphocarrier protein [Firmicutes bacterium HGW-Firmicutes-1]|jgi:phosphotransferase system HPr (HPr) family protein|nr:MAG: HPr family phosphocarrier protein [Firmicutes bacterium HGW-Firmicutes-1]